MFTDLDFFGFGVLSTNKAFVASVFGYLGLGFSLVSMTLKCNERLLKVNVFAAVFWGLNGFFLGSVTSLAVQLVCAGLTLVRIFTPIKHHRLATQLSLLAVAVACAMTWQGLYSLPVTLATLSLIVGIGLAKGIWVRVAFLVANTLFLVHAITYGAAEQIFACIACYVAIGIGVRRSYSPEQAKSFKTTNEALVK